MTMTNYVYFFSDTIREKRALSAFCPTNTAAAMQRPEGTTNTHCHAQDPQQAESHHKSSDIKKKKIGEDSGGEKLSHFL